MHNKWNRRRTKPKHQPIICGTRMGITAINSAPAPGLSDIIIFYLFLLAGVSSLHPTPYLFLLILTWPVKKFLKEFHPPNKKLKKHLINSSGRRFTTILTVIALCFQYMAQFSCLWQEFFRSMNAVNIWVVKPNIRTPDIGVIIAHVYS